MKISKDSNKNRSFLYLIKSTFNTASAHAICVEVKDMNVAADYSCSIGERIN
jgi:hypothetical protein